MKALILISGPATRLHCPVRRGCGWLLARQSRSDAWQVVEVVIEAEDLLHVTLTHVHGHQGVRQINVLVGEETQGSEQAGFVIGLQSHVAEQLLNNSRNLVARRAAGRFEHAYGFGYCREAMG